MNVMYLFTRYRFNWNEVDFSVFNTFAVVTGLVGKLDNGVKRHKRDQLINSLEHFLLQRHTIGHCLKFIIQPNRKSSRILRK